MLFFTVKAILVKGSKIAYNWHKEEALSFPGLTVDGHGKSLMNV